MSTRLFEAMATFAANFQAYEALVGGFRAAAGPMPSLACRVVTFDRKRAAETRRLLRRTLYGGRKGRRAARRLRSMRVAVEVSYGDVTRVLSCRGWGS